MALSLKTRLYVDHAFTLLQKAKYGEFVRGVVKFAGRVAADEFRTKLVTVRATSAALQSPIDAKRNRLTSDGRIVEKMSVTFPSATAPLLASIIIPCFNYGRFLGEAVQSALDQTVLSLEVIVIDDGSSDTATIEVLKTLERLSRVRVVRQENCGLPTARNNGVSLARGEYICCLDADDTLEATYMEMAIAVMEADRSVGFAYSWVQLFQDETSVWRTRDFDIDEASIDNHTSVSAVFRRDDWMAAGCFRPAMREGYEDWEFWLRLAALGRRGRVVRTPLFNHRRHGKTMTHDAHVKRREIMTAMRRSNPQIFNNCRVRKRLKRLHASKLPGDPLSSLRQPRVLAPTDGRPHLLVVAPALADGGAEVLLLEILSELRRDWRVTIVTSRSDPQVWWSKFASITTDIVPLYGAFEDEARLPVLDHLILSRGTRVLLSHGSAFAYENLAAIRRRHLNVATLDILHNDLPGGHIRNAVLASRSIGTHVAVSDRIARSLEGHGVPRERIAIIPNGIDIENQFRPDRYDRGHSRRCLGLSETTPVLAWIGRLAEEKRPHEFLAIVARLAARGPVTGLIVGDGPLAASVEKAIERGRSSSMTIIRISHVPRDTIAQVYAAADWLVLTSSVEGMPFVALEALACGCPVATTDAGDLRSLVHNGEAGFIVPVDRVGDLSDLIWPALNEPAEIDRMRVSARRCIESSRFTRSKMIESYRSVIAHSLSAANEPGT